MERSLVQELHFITTVDNMTSILEHGILCRKRANALPHISIANEEVQNRRIGKKVPNGAELHDYANLYFDARNAMMYTRRDVANLIVLRVNPNVLDLPNVVISDGNAACGPTAFYPSPEGLAHLNSDKVYAQSWNCDDPWEKIERKRQRQAEVLVPVGVHSSDIIGGMVRRKGVLETCSGLKLNVEVNSRVFFDA